MNILMANANWFPSGGDWTYVSSVCDLYIKNGHNVIPFSMSNSKNFSSEYDKYFVTNINYNELNQNKSLPNILKALYKSIYSKEAIIKLNNLLDEHHIDIAQLNNIHNIHTPAIIPVFKKRNIPVVWRVLDYKILCPNRTFLSNQNICEKCFKTKYYNCFINKCKKNSYSASLLTTIESYYNKLMPYYDMVDYYLFQSEFSRDLFVKYGFDIKKTAIIENPYDLNNHMLQETKTNIVNNPYILYFGRISKEKGIFTLYDAVKKLPNIKLIIIGDGPDLTESINYIKNSFINNIEFVGPLWGKDLEPYIQNCEFVVLPSEWYEPNPYVVLQTFSYGKTIVATAIGGLTNMIENDFNGILCNVKDADNLAIAINELFNNKNKLKFLGINARKTVELKYSPYSYYQKTIDIFTNLINKE